MDKDRVSDGDPESKSIPQSQELPSSRTQTPRKEQNVASVSVSHSATASNAVAGSESAALSAVKQPYSLSHVDSPLMWTPRRCRYNPENPPKFGWGLNLIFALVGIGHSLASC